MADKVAKVSKSEMLDTGEVKSSGISYKTIGTTLQALSVQLDKGEKILSEAGKMSWMTTNVKMQTKTQGVQKMLSRLIAAESLFVNEFFCEEGTGIVTFSTESSGKIIPLELEAGKPGVIFQRGSYLTSEQGVERSTVLTKKLSAGLFGGKGLILQKLKGAGRAHLMADGEVVMYELKSGETILADQGNLIAYEESVDFDIRTVGGGITNWLFGGEGLFLGSLTGPGKVWMQTRKQSILNSAVNAAARRPNGYGNAMNNPVGCIIGLIISFGLLFCFIMMGVLSNA